MPDEMPYEGGEAISDKTDMSYIIHIVKECEAIRQALMHVAEVCEGHGNRLAELEGKHTALDGGVNEFLTHFNSVGAARKRKEGVDGLRGQYKDNAEYNELAGNLFEAGNLKEQGYSDPWEYIFDLLGQAREENEMAIKEGAEHAEGTGGDEEKAPWDDGKYIDGLMGNVKEHLGRIAGLVKKEIPEAKVVEVKAEGPKSDGELFSEDEKKKMAEEGIREAKRIKQMKGIKN